MRMMLSRLHFLYVRYMRSFLLFLGSALLAFASVWIAEKQLPQIHSPEPVRMANAPLEQRRPDSSDLSHQLSPGMRAMSVRVSEVAGVAGFALPGNWVDVLVNTQNIHAPLVGNEQSISKIILEKVLVLAVAQETSHDDKKPKVVNAVTLEVTPEQSELLDLARSVGSLSLVLRNQSDLTLVPSSGVTRQTLLAGVDRAGISPHPQSPVHHQTASHPTVSSEPQAIEVIKGVERVAFISGQKEIAR
jgi:Flp pilus assembly protein CpaB